MMRIAYAVARGTRVVDSAPIAVVARVYPAPWPPDKSHMPSKSPHKGSLLYCRPGGLSANPARRNASVIASPLDAAGGRRFSDPIAAIPEDAGAGRASGA